MHPEEIEAQYQQSAYVKEICVLGLYAVVVPDLALMRQRRIVNIGDLLRFEMEGQSIHLPPHQRVLQYEIWFEPLPRTTAGKVKRDEIQRRLQSAGLTSLRQGYGGPPELQRRRKSRPPVNGGSHLSGAAKRERSAAESPADVDGWGDDWHAAAAAAVIARRAHGRTVMPDSNLELDLGLDSMERVELLTELEQQFGVRIADERAHEIFTVEQLIEAVRPSEPTPHAAVTEDAWALLLRDLPPADDPVLSGLLERRPFAALFFFLVARLARLLLPRIQVTGLEQLPPNGPFIITPNHQGYLDPFIVCSVLPYRTFRQMFFVGAAEYFETFFMAWVARQGNCVPVDPDANLVSAMKAGAFGLRHGKILLLFPEGERSIDGTVKRFKKGAVILSRHLGVPVVPVALRGAYEIWPRNRAINWKVLLPRTNHRVRIAIGPPLQLDDSVHHAEGAARLQEEVTRMWKAL